MRQYNVYKPQWLGLLSVLTVEESIVFCSIHCLWGFVFYALQSVLSSLAITLTRERELVALVVYLLSCYCKSFEALPHGVVGSAVCNCGIF